MTPWPIPLFLKLTALCHLGAAALWIAQPFAWPWALGLLVANHAALTAIGLWPRSTWLGENLLRLPEAAAQRGEIALTLDDGPDPDVTPAVLDLLDRHRALATFFCIARRAEQHPALLREIVRRGHSVQNHTERHAHVFSLLGPRGYAREIGHAQDILTRLGAERPAFFRAPAGLRNPFLSPVLHRLGLTLSSWTHRGFDTRERDPARVLERLTRQLRAGDILLLHDGHAARTFTGRAVILDVLPRLIAQAHERGLRFVTLPQAMAPTPTTTPAPAPASAGPTAAVSA